MFHPFHLFPHQNDQTELQAAATRAAAAVVKQSEHPQHLAEQGA